MAVTGTSALSAEVKALYDGDFYLAGQSVVYFDQFADLREQMNGQRGSSYEFPVVDSLQPNTAQLDELQDVSAQAMKASAVSVTLGEYGGAVEVTKFVVATSYADVYKQAAWVNGYNLAESFDYVVRAVAGQGGRVFFQNGRTARNQVAGQGTAADRITASFLELLGILTRSIKMPLYDDGAVCTIMHPFVFYDLLQDNTTGAGVRSMSQYSHPEILFNGELGYWGGVRIVVSSNAKGFWGAGAADASNLSTTLAVAGAVGDANIKLASVTGLVVGDWIAIQDGTEDANIWYDTNELFRVTAVGTAGSGGTGVTGFCLDPGPGDNGGLRFAHASGKTVTTSNSVYPVVMLGPNSITKVCSSFTGPYGETVVSGPFDRLGRFLTFGWYAIVGYQRTRSGWIMRGECGSSQS